MKKRIFTLSLVLGIIFLLASCSFGDVFVRKSSTTIPPSPTTSSTTSTTISTSTSKVEEKYSITYHNNGHGDEPKKENNVDKLPNPLPEMSESGYRFLGWSLASDSKVLVKAGSAISKNTDLYGVWEEITYKIEFDVKDHGAKPEDIVGVKNLPDPLPKLSEMGYKFLGWTDKDGSNIIVKAGAKISADTKLYAVWERGVYTITFDENGHGVAPNPKTGVTIIPILPRMSETGYHFLGWSLASDSTEIVTVGSEVLSNITLYGVWEEMTYTVSFDTNGHGEKPKDVENVKKIPDVLPVLSEAGFTFLGWSSSKTSTELVKAGSNITSNTTLYALWENETYSITYHTAHGEAPDSVTDVVNLPSILPTLEDEKDYTFLGWALEEGSYELVEAGASISTNVDLYAVWAPVVAYNVTYHANGHGEDPETLENVYKLPEELPTLKADNYNFIGWALEEDSFELVEAGLAISEDVDLYAVWKHKTYNVTYRANGHGEEEPNPLKGVYLLPDELPTMTDSDYNFKGWSLEDNLEELVSGGQEIFSNTDLYAVWKEKTYSITYHANGHGTAPTNITGVTYLPTILPTMVEVGYTFLGWSLSETSRVLVTGGTKLSKNTDLYGVWDEKTYTVTYDLNGHGNTQIDNATNVTKYPNPLPEPKAEGWKFRGWTESKTSTKFVTPGEAIDENKTLYAKWDKETYRVIYHSNGHGTAPHEDAGVTAYPDPLPTITVDGWEFLGWSLYSDSITALVTSGEEITSNVNLYAAWKEAKYTITFHENGRGTAPDAMIGYTHLPDELPTMSADQYVFKGWSLASDSTALVDAGRRITENTDLYGVWVSRASMVQLPIVVNNSITGNFDSNKVDEELKKIKFVVTYTDAVVVEFVANKNMISSTDYDLLCAGGKEAINVTFNVEEHDKEVTLTPWPYWNVAFYANGELFGEAHDYLEGENATAPTATPSNYLDDDNILWTFDHWDQSYNNVHENLKINAVYEKVELFSYNAHINTSNEFVISITKDTRVTDYEIKIIDTQTAEIVKTVNSSDTEILLSELVSGRTYKITGTYKYTFEDNSYEITLTDNVITAATVDELKTIDYQVDDNTISDTTISVDISEYVDKAPAGYTLDKVYLVKVSDQTTAGEYSYNNDDSIIFFEGLTAETEYETYFVYKKIQTKLTSYRLNLKRAPLRTDDLTFNYDPDYGFCFVGFRCFTHATDPNIKRVRVVYNDPEKGEVLLYRYFVSSGNDVPYSGFLYSNPWTFSLPIKYRDYYAFGNYSELTNVTEDRTVEVILVPKNDYNESTHKVVFVGYSKNSNDKKYEHIISIVTVNNGEAATQPTDFDKYVPEDNVVNSTKYHYEFTWINNYIYYGVDIKEVKKSGIVFASYTSDEVLGEPVYNYGYYHVGDDFFTYNVSFASTKSASDRDNKPIGVRAYLTVGAMGSGTEVINPDPVYSRSYVYSEENFNKLKDNLYIRSLDGNKDAIYTKVASGATWDKDTQYYTLSTITYQGKFTNIAGKYTFHYELDYDLRDGTGVHTKTIEIPFAPNGPSLHSMSATSPNYQEIDVTWSGTKSANEGVYVVSDDNESITQQFYLNGRASNITLKFDYLLTNTTYRIYSYQKGTLYLYKDGVHDPSKATEIDSIFISNTYITCTTKDGVKPEYLIIKIKTHPVVKNGVTTYNAVNAPSGIDDRISIYVGNYDKQIDIGEIRISYQLYSDENMGDLPNYYFVYFEYNATKGCYLPKDNMGGQLYYTLFGTESKAIDPDTGQERTYHYYLTNLDISWWYNNYLNGWVYPSLHYPHPEDPTNNNEETKIVLIKQ